MLHAKFQDHRDSDYDKEVFKAFYHIMGVVSILVMRPWAFIQISFPIPEKHLKFGFDWQSGFRDDL